MGWGGTWGGLHPLPTFLADQLTLSQPGGHIIPTHYCKPPPPSDFQTLRRPWERFKIWQNIKLSDLCFHTIIWVADRNFWPRFYIVVSGMTFFNANLLLPLDFYDPFLLIFYIPLLFGTFSFITLFYLDFNFPLLFGIVYPFSLGFYSSFGPPYFLI